jgi:hypothetical protein
MSNLATGRCNDAEHVADTWRKQKAIIVPIQKAYLLKASDYVGVRIYEDLTVLVARAPEIPNIGFRVRKFFKPTSLVEFILHSDTEMELKRIEEGNGAWFAYFQMDYDGNLPHWAIVDLDGFRLNKCRAFGRSRDTDRVWRITDFPAGILLAASKSVRNTLPVTYQIAMWRRQSGSWEPYKGLPALIDLRKGISP